MADESTEAIIERIHCNTCRQKSRHQLLCKNVFEENEDLEGGPTIEWTITHETFQCCGCGMAVLRRTMVSGIDDFDSIQYFPPVVSRHPPSWRHKCPPDMWDLIDEVYRSLDAAIAAFR